MMHETSDGGGKRGWASSSCRPSQQSAEGYGNEEEGSRENRASSLGKESDCDVGVIVLINCVASVSVLQLITRPSLDWR